MDNKQVLMHMLGYLTEEQWLVLFVLANIMIFAPTMLGWWLGRLQSEIGFEKLGANKMLFLIIVLTVGYAGTLCAAMGFLGQWYSSN